MEAIKNYEVSIDSVSTSDKEIDLPDLMHGYRVAELARKIAKHLNMSFEEITDLYVAGIFHDLGKCVIDRTIRDKPGRLNSWERRIMNEHVRAGALIGVKMNLSLMSIRYILGHHENYDGTGYPVGIKGEEIPMGARILKICDCYDALCMDRPYRGAFKFETVMEILESEKDTFDPKLYELFKEIIHGDNGA